MAARSAATLGSQQTLCEKSGRLCGTQTPPKASVRSILPNRGLKGCSIRQGPHRPESLSSVKRVAVPWKEMPRMSGPTQRRGVTQKAGVARAEAGSKVNDVNVISTGDEPSDEQRHDRLHPPEASTSATPPLTPQPFRPFGKPRYFFFQLSKVSIGANDVLDKIFKSELRKRLFITVAFMFIVRGGYYIPLPGFDRRFHSTAMDIASGSMSPLGDLSAEVPWNFFQLGVGPEISASILISFLSNIIPYLKALKDEGADGVETLKQEMKKYGDIIAVLQAFFVAFSSRAHAIYYKDSPVSYFVWTVALLLLGFKTISFISKKIGELGFGQGSSVIISLGILEGYRKFLHSVFVNAKARTLTLNQIGVWLGSVVIMTIGAAFLTQAFRKIPLKFYQVEEGVPGSLQDVIEDQYVPILINPGGMQPIMVASIFIAVPKFIAGVTKGRAIVAIASWLDPTQHPVFFHALTFGFIFLCNLVDISDNPSELSKWLAQIGARVPNIRPGRQTIEYLRYVQTSARFWDNRLALQREAYSSATQLPSLSGAVLLGGIPLLQCRGAARRSTGYRLNSNRRILPKNDARRGKHRFHVYAHSRGLNSAGAAVCCRLSAAT